MANPLVSICVPTRNRAGLLRETLRTIRAQEYAPLEILISDNCSDDATEQLCREIAGADARVRYVRQPRNIGMHANHNFCIDESRGEFLGFFHDDDVYDPSIVSHSVAFLLEHPEVGVVCSDWDMIDEAGRVVGVRDHDVKPVTAGLEYIERTLRSGRSSLGLPGALIRRPALGAARFDEDAPLGFGDFVLWFRIAERAAAGHIARRLWRYRVHRLSHSRRTIESMTDDYDLVITRYLDEHVARWPGHAAAAARWRAATNRYLFWALVYEVSLHFRDAAPAAAKPPDRRTVFELTDYRLTPDEFQKVLTRLKAYRAGLVQHAVLATIHLLLRMGWTWTLAWAGHRPSSLRGILGLK